MAKKKDPLLEITGDCLRRWAGEKVAARGRGYRSFVSDLRMMIGNALIAWVDGTERYVTKVWFESRRLTSECTCPYDGGNCKHAVAVILVYQDAANKRKPVPKMERGDTRIRILDDWRRGDEWGTDDFEDEDGFEDDFADDEDEDRCAPRSMESIRRHLESLRKPDLIGQILEWAVKHPELLDGITDQISLQGGKVGAMVASIRREIEDLAAEPAWRSHWTGEGNTPDYSRVRERLQSLLDAGHADAVVDLGRTLWEEGLRQVARSDDEGDTASEIASCMAIVIKAVPKSSMALKDQVLWLIRIVESDEYGLLDSAGDLLEKRQYTKKEWSAVADVLLEQLANLPLVGKEGDYHRSYVRKKRMEWALEALEKSRRHDEILPILEREAPITKCYPRLVDILIASGKLEKAKEWAERGYADTVGSWSGISSTLVERLRDMAQRSRDYPLVAAYRAHVFFESPSLEIYLELEKAVRKGGCWPVIREACLRYLEEGKCPGDQVGPERAGRGKRITRKRAPAKRSAVQSASWPLPPTGLPPAERRHPGLFPRADVLIDIAIHEKRPEDALKWHSIYTEKHRAMDGKSEEVAEAVRESHLDAAVDIWRALTECLIVLTKPGAYREAAPHLRNIRKVREEQGRTKEWLGYIEDLRSRHRRKRKLMEVLDAVEGKRRPRR